MQKIFPFTIRVNFQVLVLKDMLPAKMLLKTREEKNLLCVLVRLHADAKQKVSGRTSFNISARNELKFVKTVWDARREKPFMCLSATTCRRQAES